MLLSIKMTSKCLWPRPFTWTRGETATRWKCLHHLHSRLLGEENVSLLFEMNDCPPLKYPKILCLGLFAHRASLTHRRCPEASRSRTPRLVFESFQLKGVKKNSLILGKAVWSWIVLLCCCLTYWSYPLWPAMLATSPIMFPQIISNWKLWRKPLIELKLKSIFDEYWN